MACYRWNHRRRPHPAQRRLVSRGLHLLRLHLLQGVL